LNDVIEDPLQVGTLVPFELGLLPVVQNRFAGVPDIIRSFLYRRLRRFAHRILLFSRCTGNVSAESRATFIQKREQRVDEPKG
jgi:hypothetical protein